jgi:hypothetical protein
MLCMFTMGAAGTDVPTAEDLAQLVRTRLGEPKAAQLRAALVGLLQAVCDGDAVENHSGTA